MTSAALDLKSALSWLKRVAGIDDDYIARWPAAAWTEWAKAMHADRHGPNPSVPEWMQPHLGTWHQDFSGPFPCVAQLWPSAHNWFAEADNHLDFSLVIEEPNDNQQPTLAQVRAAWEYATVRGATPLLSISVVPATPYGDAVTGEIEAFYVVGTKLDGLGGALDRILDSTGTAVGDLARDAASVMQHAGLAAHPEEELRAWEWMYG